ncbi:MAG: hypothetical protein ACI97A_000679 [Planctomycetota bacterium]|jgi:hypothetical protein
MQVVKFLEFRVMAFVGAMAFAGMAYGQLSPIYTFLGDAPGDSLGYSVCGVGDLDGDGCDDLA